MFYALSLGQIELTSRPQTRLCKWRGQQLDVFYNDTQANFMVPCPPPPRPTFGGPGHARKMHQFADKSYIKEVHSELSQTSKIEFFAKNNFRKKELYLRCLTLF